MNEPTGITSSWRHQWSAKTRREKTMTEQITIAQSVNPTVQQTGKYAQTLADLDRVMLADVKKHWGDFQSSRNRDAIYGYLHVVFTQVEFWARNPLEKIEALRAVRQQDPKLTLPQDPFAVVIACTSDPKKVDDKVRSKWTRVLRYAAKYKPEKELLRDFLQRKGGINKCAARYARRLGRNSKVRAMK
jgi:hypothetical protein